MNKQRKYEFVKHKRSFEHHEVVSFIGNNTVAYIPHRGKCSIETGKLFAASPELLEALTPFAKVGAIANLERFKHMPDDAVIINLSIGPHGPYEVFTYGDLRKAAEIIERLKGVQ